MARNHATTTQVTTRAPEALRGAAPAGHEWVISGGGYEAAVMQVGATLRSLTRAGRPLLSGFGADEQATAYRGAVLAPWPNRVRDGRYRYADTDYQLALTEPERRNALHGLLCWQEWRAVVHEPARLVCETTLRPQPGWAWTLTCRVTYELGDDGLAVTPWARNESATTAPFGYGMHPYLTCGEHSVDELELALPAALALDVDPARLLPTAEPATEALGPVPAEVDLRAGPPLVGRRLDTAYAGLSADPDGCWRARLSHPASGRTTTLWAPLRDFGWAQVFSGDALPEPERRRTGVAVEPMTCGPDALRDGTDLIALAPGEEWSATWGLTGS